MEWRSQLLSAVVLLGAAGFCRADINFYVAPDGRDDQAGTLDQPFASLVRARNAVRELIRTGLPDHVNVFLRQGFYTLDAPLVLGPEDSPGEQHAVTYLAQPGEGATLSGGVPVGPWRVREDGVWVAELPEVRAGAWYPRQLFMGGERRTRAREPNQGYFRGLQSTDGKTVVLPPGQGLNWSKRGDIELVAFAEWTASRMRLPETAAPDGSLEFASPAMPYFGVPYGEHIRKNVAAFPYYFENSPEMLDAPGEWYLDRASGVLCYHPIPGENPETASAVVSRLPNLIQVLGRRGQSVKNVRFHNLTFSYTDWPLPPTGFLPLQAGLLDPHTRLAPAIQLEFADACHIDGCTLRRLGGVAISLGLGCHDNRITGNEIVDVAGTGVEVGGIEARPREVSDVAKHNLIGNNIIRRCAVEYAGSVGIWIGITELTVVSHNEVSELPYSGISVGWKWDRDKTAATNNVIEYNHIHHVVQLLADGGGIYTLGLQPGGILRGNLIHDVAHYSGLAPTNGIFMDEGSKGWRIEDNVIYNTADSPMRRNQAKYRDQSWGQNWENVLPGALNFPTTIADLAGLEPAYRRGP